LITFYPAAEGDPAYPVIFNFYLSLLIHLSCLSCF
jgi:hypothetical protein